MSERGPQCVKEALLCGTPMASFDVGVVSEIVENVPGTAVVPLDDIDGLFEASLRLLKEKRRSVGRNRMQKILPTEQQHLEELKEFYKFRI